MSNEYSNEYDELIYELIYMDVRIMYISRNKW